MLFLLYALILQVLKWKLVDRSVATSRIQLFLKCAYNIFDVCGLVNELCTTELGSVASTLVSVVEFITDDVLLLMVDDCMFAILHLSKKIWKN